MPGTGKRGPQDEGRQLHVASSVSIKDLKEGRIMKGKRGKVVTLRTKRDRKPKKDISKEPEMVELKRMIKDGELDKDRTMEHLEEEDKAESNEE